MKMGVEMMEHAHQIFLMMKIKMSRKSVHLDSATVLKNIRKDLMSFAKDEILDIKKSKKEISIENFDKTESIPSNKFSLTTKSLTIQNPKNYKSNIESIKEKGKNNIKKEDKKDDKENEISSSDISDNDEDDDDDDE